AAGDGPVRLEDRAGRARRDAVVAGAPLAGRGAQHDRQQILDEEEVAARIDREAALAGCEALVESRNGSAQVARPVDVREPERDEVEPAEGDVALPGRLRDRVARLRPEGVSKGDGLLMGRVAVAERGL